VIYRELSKKTLTKLIDKHEVISFDIFDTMLLRPFSKPTDIFWYIEKVLKISGFALARIGIEEELRKNLNGAEEVLLSEIYDKIPEYSKLMNIELEYEEKLLYPNKEIQDIFNTVVNLKKKIIIISDIYLPEVFIARILKAKGYGNYNRLYVSSTFGKVKWTGNLFRAVFNDLHILPKKILHIGDNFHSDCEMANSLNMNAVFYPKVIDRYLKNNPYRIKFSEVDMDSCVYSALLMQIANRSRFGYSGYWHKFGYELAGPICYAYTKYIAKEAASHPEVTDIAFVARDGYLLKKIYDQLFADKNIRTHYIYAPRSFNLIYRLDYDVGYDTYVSNLSRMKTILNHYKICLPKKNVDIEKLSHDEVKELMSANFDIIRKYADEGYENYKNYLKSDVFRDGMAFVVDTATDSFSAQKLISNSIANNVLGIYWCVMSNGAENAQSNVFKCFQKESHHTIKSWNLVEFIITSPEPPIKSIKNGNPVYFSINGSEARRIKIFKEMERGIAEFINEVKASPLSELSIDNNIVTCWVNDFIDNPHSFDREAFKPLYFSSLLDHSDLISLSPFKQEEEFVTTHPIFCNIKTKVKNYAQKHPFLYKFLHRVNKIFKK